MDYAFKELTIIIVLFEEKIIRNKINNIFFKFPLILKYYVFLDLP